jgi:diguanylate cyclase (GGDEF)-like protein
MSLIPHPWLQKIHVWLRHLPRNETFLLSVLFATLIAIPDELSHHEVSWSLFYLAPISVATWYTGRRRGFYLALYCVIVSLLPDLIVTSLEHAHQIAVIWNALTHVVSYLLVVILLDLICQHITLTQTQANTDILTGILNRRAFTEMLQHAIRMSRREGKPLTLAYVDVDNFKLVNDQFGHGEGDQVLQLIARGLGEYVRETDTIGRIGGDEFAIILPHTPAAEAETILLRLHEATQTALQLRCPQAGLSIGAVSFIIPADDAASVLATADSVMYEVKLQGKGQVVIRLHEIDLDALRKRARLKLKRT